MKSPLQQTCCVCCGHDTATMLYQLKTTHLCRCNACSFVFVNPRPDPVLFQEKLESWARQDIVDEQRLRIAFDQATLVLYRSYIHRLSRLTKGTGTLVDIGCSTGSFLSIARNEGWAVQGIEAAKASSAYARETLGLTVTTGFLENVSYQQQFKAAICTEVIEHLPDPKQALFKINSLLQPDGVLLLTTPNFDSLYRRLFGPRWWVVNCEDEHISLFRPKTITTLLISCGFTIESMTIRNINIAGILAELFKKNPVSKNQDNNLLEHGYYEAQNRKESIKKTIKKLGILTAIRILLSGADRLFSIPCSPVYAWGEQLVVFARKTGALPKPEVPV